MSDLDTEPKPSRRLWIFAAVGALVLHLGGAALAFAHLRSDDPDDSLGAPAIEIGLEMTSPHVEATDLPPGPDTDASVASPALAEQKAEVKETELPKDVPTETEDPDRVVTPNDFQQAQGRRSESRRGANLGLDGIGRGRGHRDAQHRGDSGRAEVGGSRARLRRERAAHARDLAEGTDRASRQAQALSGRALAKDRRDSGQLRAGPARVMCCRPASSRDRAMPRSTRPPWRWCGAPIRCRSRRRWSPTRD